MVDGGGVARTEDSKEVMLVNGAGKVFTLFLFGHPDDCSIFTKGNT